MKSVSKIAGLVTLVLLSCTAFAQSNTGWQLFGHSNGKDVRLIWSRSEWPMETDGIVVKRRVAGGNWQTLTATPVIPYVNPAKNISNVSNDPAHIDALKKKMQEDAKNYTIDSLEFLRIISKTEGLSMFMFALAKNYDLTLVSGFGYEDVNVVATKGVKVEYGIFVQTFGKLEATPAALWSYTAGQVTTLDMRVENTVKAKKKRNEVKVQWSLPSDKIIQAKVIYAFNIYRTVKGNRTLLTPSPVLANVYEPVCKMPYIDTLQDMTQKVVYELVPVSIMGWETSGYSATYDPLQFPDAFTPELISLYKDGEKQLQFTWNLPPQVIPFVDSIQLQEFNGATAYTRIGRYDATYKSVFIPYDTIRAYPAKYTFRIQVFLKTDEEPVNSIDVSVVYNPNVTFDPVTGITAKYLQTGQERFIALKWDPVQGAAGYLLFLKDNQTDKMIWEASYKIIPQTEFQYPVVINTSKSYTFSIAAVDAKGMRAGELKNIVTVVTPSQYLLRVWWKESGVVNDSLVRVSWTYTEPDDVVGYRIYENGSLITDEKVLQRGKTEWISSPRKKGKYIYQIEAITLTGVASPKSEERIVNIK